jgi:cytochrome c biogenesis protein CcmG/thiol:disulfide interchange protein DsbE
MHRLRLAVVIAGLIVPAVAAFPKNENAPGKAAAPHFKLPTDSGYVDSDSLRGDVVLVDFWASWCAPCQQSFPWLDAIHRQYAGKGLRVVAINLDKKHAPAEAFLDKHPAGFTVAFDADGTAAEAFRVKGMPSTYLVDRDGNVVYSHVGFDPGKTGPLEEAIRRTCS